ncbi:MAG: hypothetical protein Q8Q95_00615 [bacterium]|nr:hypothetical protein [bacterium]
MSGTMIRIVETIFELGTINHQKAVEEVVIQMLRLGAYVDSAVTTATPAPPPREYMMLRITTIVFTPS